MGNSESKNNLKIILDDSSDLSLNQLRDLLNNMSSSEIAHADYELMVFLFKIKSKTLNKK